MTHKIHVASVNYVLSLRSLSQSFDGFFSSLFFGNQCHDLYVCQNKFLFVKASCRNNYCVLRFISIFVYVFWELLSWYTLKYGNVDDYTKLWYCLVNKSFAFSIKMILFMMHIDQASFMTSWYLDVLLNLRNSFIILIVILIVNISFNSLE